MRSIAALIPTAALLLMHSPVLLAQDTTISASLLRVLAEAADAHRTGQPLFLVARYQFPHTVVGRFSTRRQAEKLRADSGPAFGVFGPYVTADDAPATERAVHIRVTMEGPDRRRRTISVDPRVDALFFSLSAIDKFVIPYYTRLYGPEYAQTLRVFFRKKKPGCHVGSVSCYPAPNGKLELFRPPEPAGATKPEDLVR